MKCGLDEPLPHVFLGIYEGYPEINFRSHVEHEVVGAARRGCTAV
jgi:hypothetical protein